MEKLYKAGFEDLKDKVIFISGASNGIGKAAALLFSQFGAKLVLAARSKAKLEKLKDEIISTERGDALAIPLDVRDELACTESIEETVSKFKRVDVLINNAGIGIPTPDLSNVDTEDFRSMMETNVNGVFFLTRQALKHMKQAGKGHIVMISSPAGIKSNPTAPLYCTSKFALEGYTDGLRQQTDSWKKEGINIRITNIKPGSVDSGYWGKRDVPRPKFMTCEEMASALFWAVATKNTMNIYDIRMESRR